MAISTARRATVATIAVILHTAAGPSSNFHRTMEVGSRRPCTPSIPHRTITRVILNGGNIYGTSQGRGGVAWELSGGVEQYLEWLPGTGKPTNLNTLIFGGKGVYGTSETGGTSKKCGGRT